MKKIKILNAYASIGGNRKFWNDERFEITAIELEEKVANVYKKYYPKDNVIVGDAHEYILRNYKEFDIIWASPPCQTHSRLVCSNEERLYNKYNMSYPDMKLYQEIILLSNFFKGKYVIENVTPYYKPLISPNSILDRHYFWCNFIISNFHKKDKRKHSDIERNSTVYGFNVSNEDIPEKRKTLRNLVDPELGLHILNCALKNEKNQMEIDF